mgnify:CR=1 FL=1
MWKSGRSGSTRGADPRGGERLHLLRYPDPLPGPEGAAEILTSRACGTVTEAKVVGSKLIFKGVFTASLLYRANDGRSTRPLPGSCPCSQIMGGGGRRRGHRCLCAAPGDRSGLPDRRRRAHRLHAARRRGRLRPDPPPPARRRPRPRTAAADHRPDGRRPRHDPPDRSLPFRVRVGPRAGDYVYRAEDLRTLAGRRYQPKRNHINDSRPNTPTTATSR